jgi:site-specific DNA-methyltransferase (adenine-specific)
VQVLEDRRRVLKFLSTKPMPATPKPQKSRAVRNRTVELFRHEEAEYRREILFPDDTAELAPVDKIICGDAFDVLSRLPDASFDLLFADPPYNLTKDFGEKRFRQLSSDAYEEWLDSWLTMCVPLLKPDASVYICGDWRSGSSIERVGSKHFILRNRITWEREKGRGARENWKNTAEDIWYFTVSDDFTFDLDAVKVRRKVIAPYTVGGEPKDWEASPGGNYRDTHPSNLWTDISVPFWSMPENTDHPTQKPEKLLAKIILASTHPGDRVLDPFAGSGTTAVTAKKLGRGFTAIESDEHYCLLAQKRLAMAGTDQSIQGFDDGVFWERNSRRSKK